MKIVAVTNCDSWLYENFGCRKLIYSFKYFHPDIPIIWYNEHDTNRIIKKNPGFDLWSYMPIIIKEVKEKYNADLVIKLDADSIVLNRFDEVLECKDETEVFGVRNDGDHIGDRDESANRPQIIRNLPNHLYVNCGFIATSSDSFIDNWYELNKQIIKNNGSIKSIPLAEQGTYNILFHCCNYKTKILDPKGGGLFYGASANFDSKNNFCAQSIKDTYNGVFYNWSSWKDIKYCDGKFILNDKVVKILHKTGGSNGVIEKLHWDLFSEDILSKLKEITNE